MELARGTLSRLTFEPGDERDPVWTSDGREIAFASSRGGDLDLWSVPADGSERPRRLLQAPADQVPESWVPGGRALVFSEEFGEGGSDLWLLAEGGERRPLLRTPFDERSARLSPDGRWLAYVSDESGRDEVYVRSFPPPGGKVQVSVGGGDRPWWTPNGDALTFRSGDRRVRVALALAAGGAELRPAATVPLRRDGELENYGIGADGDAELVLRDGGAARPRREITVVVPR
jgi:serine/threonine-protein kinase